MMSVSVNRHKNKGLSIISAVLFVVGSSAFGLMSCGGGGDSTPPPPPPIVDQDASGLYKSGTGTLDGVGVSDIIAFVHDGRLMAFSVKANLLIDGTIDSVTEDAFVATVNVYKDGVLAQPSVNVTGMATNGSQVSGTLNGTGVGSGDFTVTFDPLYNRGATNARINSQSSNYEGPMSMQVSGMNVENFEVLSDNSYTAGPVSLVPTAISCILRGDLSIPDSIINIYTLVEIVEDNLNCPTELISTNYTGFFAVVDGVAEDDTLLYASTNGEHAMFAVLIQP